MPDKGPGSDDQQVLGLIPFGEVNGSWEGVLRTALKPTYPFSRPLTVIKGQGCHHSTGALILRNSKCREKSCPHTVPGAVWGPVGLYGKGTREAAKQCPAGLEGVLCSDYAVYGGWRPTLAPSSRNTLGCGGQEMREPKLLDTHLVTTAILTPKTPVCFREGILFKLNSLLVNLTESFTSICKQRREMALSPSWSTPYSSRLITTNLFSTSFFLNHKK